MLVLEYSPHLFHLPEQPVRRLDVGRYETYRKRLVASELAVSGLIRQLVGLENPLVLNHRALKLRTETFVDGAWTPEQCFYGLRYYSVSEHKLGRGGHVQFKAFLPDRNAADVGTLRPQLACR